jgi:hypothetical protein
MINAQELRYGNKLLFLDDVVTFKNITEFREDGIYWIKPVEPKIEAKSFHFKPIELTEEWLLKFGFEKPAHTWICNIFHLTEWDDFPLNWAVAMNKNGAIVVLKLKYVHQLQNLYFALTGEELIDKNNKL